TSSSQCIPGWDTCGRSWKPGAKASSRIPSSPRRPAVPMRTGCGRCSTRASRPSARSRLRQDDFRALRYFCGSSTTGPFSPPRSRVFSLRAWVSTVGAGALAAAYSSRGGGRVTVGPASAVGTTATSPPGGSCTTGAVLRGGLPATAAPAAPAASTPTTAPKILSLLIFMAVLWFRWCCLDRPVRGEVLHSRSPRRAWLSLHGSGKGMEREFSRFDGPCGADGGRRSAAVAGGGGWRAFHHLPRRQAEHGDAGQCAGAAGPHPADRT